jgi:hypothetical protein
MTVAGVARTFCPIQHLDFQLQVDFNRGMNRFRLAQRLETDPSLAGAQSGSEGEIIFLAVGVWQKLLLSIYCQKYKIPTY